MKKFLKTIGVLLGVLFALIAIYCLISNESLPKGTQGKEAEAKEEKEEETES